MSGSRSPILTFALVAGGILVLAGVGLTAHF